jgi:hypothetical protein
MITWTNISQHVGMTWQNADWKACVHFEQELAIEEIAMIVCFPMCLSYFMHLWILLRYVMYIVPSLFGPDLIGIYKISHWSREDRTVVGEITNPTWVCCKRVDCHPRVGFWQFFTRLADIREPFILFNSIFFQSFGYCNQYYFNFAWFAFRLFGTFFLFRHNFKLCKNRSSNKLVESILLNNASSYTYS